MWVKSRKIVILEECLWNCETIHIMAIFLMEEWLILTLSLELFAFPQHLPYWFLQRQEPAGLWRITVESLNSELVKSQEWSYMIHPWNRGQSVPWKMVLPHRHRNWNRAEQKWDGQHCCFPGKALQFHILPVCILHIWVGILASPHSPKHACYLIWDSKLAHR